jgi:hypothetical protein
MKALTKFINDQVVTLFRKNFFGKRWFCRNNH